IRITSDKWLPVFVFLRVGLVMTHKWSWRERDVGACWNGRSGGTAKLLSRAWRRNTLPRRNDVVLEVARAIGLGPKPDLAHDRRPQYRIVRRVQVRRRRALSSRRRLAAEYVLQSQRPVDPRFQVGAFDGQLHLMPRVSIEQEGFGAVAEFQVSPNAVME